MIFFRGWQDSEGGVAEELRNLSAKVDQLNLSAKVDTLSAKVDGLLVESPGQGWRVGVPTPYTLTPTPCTLHPTP